MPKYVISNMWAGEPGNMPGVGHQFRLWMAGYILAQKAGCKFVHNPFCGNETQDWDGVGRVDVPVSKWENFLDFGRDELTTSDLPEDTEIFPLSANTNMQQWIKFVKSEPSSSNFLYKCPFNQFTPIHWDIFLNNRFKQKYWDKRLIDCPASHFSGQNTVKVAIHIRRCDVTPQRYPDRYLPNSYYEQVLKQLVDAIPNCEIHIYSDAKEISELSNLVQFPNTKFHLRCDIFETFHAMVSADIFITGIGSFSILASYITKGAIITTPWNNAWNNFPENSMIVPAQRNGNFSKQILDEKLSCREE